MRTGKWRGGKECARVISFWSGPKQQIQIGEKIDFPANLGGGVKNEHGKVQNCKGSARRSGTPK